MKPKQIDSRAKDVYMVSRTSVENEIRPCPEAYKAEVWLPRVEVWKERWVMEAGDIVDFIDKHDVRIILWRHHPNAIPEIEIYDRCRE